MDLAPMGSLPNRRLGFLVEVKAAGFEDVDVESRGAGRKAFIVVVGIVKTPVPGPGLAG